MDKWISRLSNIAVIAIAVVAIYLAWNRPAGAVQSASSVGYQVGDQIDRSRFTQTKRTLIVVTRSGCHFCTESMPFYQSLDGVSVMWVALGEDAATNRLYLESHGLKPKMVLTADELGLTKVHSTPQLLLVDRQGTVLETWVGKVPAAEQAKVIARVKGA